VKTELRRAQKSLKEIKQRAFELWEEHLRELLSITQEKMGQKKNTKNADKY
jgi:3-methyladenine DNA glycosylase AlkD